MSKRTFIRMEASDDLEICFGLSATHHFVSGELSFEALVEERGATAFALQEVNPFLKKPSTPIRRKDVWDSPYEANVGQTHIALESIDYHIRANKSKGEHTAKEKYHSHRVNIINCSAHGYCVRWPQDSEAYIKTGEVVGIKQPNSHNWSIGVIRWVNHKQGKQTQLGLELLSPSASPYGARIIHKKGAKAEFIRILVLPDIPAIKHPVTLLTPKVPFRTGQKVVLNQRGKEIQITLDKKLNDTGAYCQFMFRKIAAKTGVQNFEVDNGINSDSEFDSLWNSL